MKITSKVCVIRKGNKWIWKYRKIGGNMNIKIDDTYSIKSDLRNVMLVETKISQSGKSKGEEVESTLSFHGTLESALKDYKRVMINTSEATSVKQLLKRVEEIDKKIEKVLGGI